MAEEEKVKEKDLEMIQCTVEIIKSNHITFYEKPKLA